MPQPRGNVHKVEKAIPMRSLYFAIKATYSVTVSKLFNNESATITIIPKQTAIRNELNRIAKHFFEDSIATST